MDKDSARLTPDFFNRDVLQVAPSLIGKWLLVRGNNNIINRLMVNEVEAYRGTDDLACHASKGRTARTETMFGPAGHLYVYLVYGMYWMLNIVTSGMDDPQAVLIRGAGIYHGPGKLTRALGINKEYNNENITLSDRIWMEGPGEDLTILRGPRIGVGYAGEYWAGINWRFYAE